MKPGIFSRVAGLDDLIASNDSYTYFPFVIAGRTISSSLSSGNRVGAIMAEADNYEEAEALINDALQKISAIDNEGNDLSFWKE